MGYIYKITNRLNGKVYIGQTTSTVEKRWEQHKKRAKNDLNRNEHFILAIRKWGPENFLLETVEECPDEKLSEREQYWIDYYDSYATGYNSTRGGEGGLLYDENEILQLWQNGLTCQQIADELDCNRSTISKYLQNNNIPSMEIKERGYTLIKEKLEKAVCQYNQVGELLQTYSSAAQAAAALTCSPEAIAQACRTSPYTNGYFWQYLDDTADIKERIENYYQNKNLSKKRPVLKFDFNGQLIQKYPSIIEAANEHNCSSENICRACNDYYGSACGFIWQYADDDYDIIKRIQDINNKPDPRGLVIKQYSLTGEYLNTYNSLTDAAKVVGGSKDAISKAVNKYSSANFFWITSGNEELLPQLIQKRTHKHDSKKKAVNQYSLTGNFIQTFDSAKDAASALGAIEKYKSINRTCQGYQQTCLGFKWSYTNT